MAYKNLGKVVPTAATDTLVYSSSTKEAVFTVSVCNTNTGVASVRVAISDSSTTPAAADYVEYDTVVRKGNTYERTGLVVGPNKHVLVYSTLGNVVFNVFGVEV